jgi:hypothetical protein
LKHIFGGGDRRYFSCVETLSCLVHWIVEGHKKASANSGTLGINCADAKGGGDRGIDCISSVLQHHTAKKEEELREPLKCY